MKHNRIFLALPAKAEYILTVRMLVASVASRMSFSVDTIEDIKSGAAEACILFLTTKNAPELLNIEVTADDKFVVTITGEGLAESAQEVDRDGEELAKCLIEEFYDRADYEYDKDTLAKIVLVKQS
ncbi:MAG: hypothetical protein AB1Z19_07550 [Eubacteriales bacterium]